MGTALLAEQKELARQYCPDILKRLERAERNVATLKYRRSKVYGGIGIHETVSSWVLRMRHEIAAEMEVVIFDIEE